MTLPEALRALSPEQKLAIVTELWDDLAASAPLSLPPEDMAEMLQRREEMLANPGVAIDRDELWRQVNEE